VTSRSYDALVFGGGSAGMAAAARIAAAGFSVAVLEREQELGGCSTSASTPASA